jgi:hypothetical protein
MTDYVLGRTDGPLLIENKNRIQNALVMAQRTIHDDLNLMLTANRTANRTEFDRGVFDQSFQAVAAKLDYRPAGRFQSWTQVRQTDSSLESTPFQLPGAEPVTLPSARVNNRMWDGEARFEIATGTNLFGRTEFTNVRAPPVEGVQQSGNFVSSGGGIRIARKWKNLNLAGSYYLFTTRTNFARDTNTNLWGQALDASVSGGDPSRLRVSAGFMMNRSRESVRGSCLTPARPSGSRALSHAPFFIPGRWRSRELWSGTAMTGSLCGLTSLAATTAPASLAQRSISATAARLVREIPINPPSDSRPCSQATSFRRHCS